nr:MAG TPA: Meiosis-expressed gene 1 protein [Caudoviricetes sp.]DAX58987.1 MAG TPA: Meiosis-expressed protein [Caudoviricetes sp.]
MRCRPRRWPNNGAGFCLRRRPGAVCNFRVACPR